MNLSSENCTRVKFELFAILIISSILSFSCEFIFAKNLGALNDIDFNLNETNESINNSPIVFIPGDGGSQLEARLNKTDRVHYVCALQSDWYDIWINIHLLFQPALDCLIDNMRLHYDPVTRKTRNTFGVQIRPTNFGSLDSVDYLDVAKLTRTGYFSEIITALEKNNGYTRNVDMVGAGFDFRRAPNELDTFFSNLTTLIESTYIRNGYKPITLICHSMGCLNTLYLLNGKAQGWKDVHIKRLMSLAAPFGGSFKAIKAMLYGDNLGIPILSGKKLKDLQASFPILMYLFPKKQAYSGDRVLIQTSSNNYTLKNLDQLFIETGMINQREMWYDTRYMAANLTAPNVELWCLYGAGIETPNSIVHSGDFKLGKYDDYEYSEIAIDGDGTVSVESSHVCKEYRKLQDKPVYIYQFDEVDHMDILRGDRVDFISRNIMRI